MLRYNSHQPRSSTPEWILDRSDLRRRRPGKSRHREHKVNLLSADHPVILDINGDITDKGETISEFPEVEET
ncbi:MAG: hypothetical protein QXE79_03650 [Candidatus Bathyarchaeia archaeon]